MPSYFYPVTSGIYLEDISEHSNMLVMNDRPQGGSAYHDGRIELMFNRFGTTNDNLGVMESMQDLDLSGNTHNVSASYKLYFSSNSKEV